MELGDQVSKTWFLVEVVDAVGSDILGDKILKFTVSPLLIVFDEMRGTQEWIDDASDRGFEVAYASSLFGASRLHMDRLKKVVLDRVRREYDVPGAFDLSIEPVARATDYGKTISK